MAAFVVAPPSASAMPRTGERLNIFPGSATPAVFRTDEAFWVGYGFVSEPCETVDERVEPGGETRFELEVDGKPVALHTDLKVDSSGSWSSLHSIANFESGLPPGWHRFSGRWYVAGKLVLSNDRSIEFVER